MVPGPNRLFANLSGLLKRVLAIPAVAAVVCCASAIGGEPARFAVEVWDSDRGLPQNSVISMLQGREGYLWVGTMNGLARFDGVQFTGVDEQKLPGLAGPQVVHLFQDSVGRLWLSTESGGLGCISQGQFQALPVSGGGRDTRVVSSAEDRSGAIWFYTAGGQLLRFFDGKVQVWNASGGRPSALRVAVVDASGLLWLGMDHQLLALDPKQVTNSPALPVVFESAQTRVDYLLASSGGGHWRLANGRIQRFDTNQVVADLGPYPWNQWQTRVNSATEDVAGNLIIGTTDQGVFWFDSAGGHTRISSASGLSHNTVLSTTVDREGNLWVGTDGGGLNLVKRQVFGVLEVTRGLAVRSVSEGANGALWVAYNGARIDLVREGTAKTFGPENGLFNLVVRSIFSEPDGRVWAGTYGGGVLLFGGDTFVPAPVPALNVRDREVAVFHSDRSGRLWIGTERGLSLREETGWRHFGTADGLESAAIRAVADDTNGNVYVGTAAGLYKFVAEKRFDRIARDELPSQRISAILPDAADVLWVGTGAGLSRFRHGQWVHIARAQGLPASNIGFLLDDGQGYLWLGSQGGLMRLRKDSVQDSSGTAYDLQVRSYGRPDGMPSGECSVGSQPAALRTRSGQLWFPTIKGLATVDVDKIRLNTNPPPVVIESILIDGVEQITNGVLNPGAPPDVQLRPGQERLEIRYTSLSLTSPESARFRYRLEPQETGWTHAGPTRVARYPRLPPGEYRFVVTASNEDSLWNPTGVSFSVTVLPPFYRTWWFMTFSTVLGLLLISGVVYYISTQRLQRQLAALRQQEALERERGRIARDLHDQLGANLTQVALLGELAEVDKDLPSEVETHAQQIQQTARETTRALDEIVWTVNPQNDTLEGLVNYICKYAQDYLALAGFKYRLDVPASLPQQGISPEVRHNVFLVVKEAINNVVKHSQGSAATVRLSLVAGHRFAVEIEDNGKGIQPGDQNKGRSGLVNMRRRMQDIGGEFATMPAPEGGTLVRLTAPFIASPPQMSGH